MLDIDREILAPALLTLCAVEGHPTRRLVAGAPKALRINEGFQEQYRMTDALLPVR